jgi:hypothetical protein
MEQFMKKSSIFFFAFAAAQYCGRKKAKIFDLSDGVLIILGHLNYFFLLLSL